MGANEFSTISAGKTIQRAYAAAVESAEYEYGHDPYNGTISTTSGTFEVVAPKRTSVKALRRLITLAIHKTDEFIDFDHDHNFPSYFTAEDRRYRRKIATEYRNLSDERRDFVDHIAGGFEKWGSCAGIKLVGTVRQDEKIRLQIASTHQNVYLFVGMAAS